MLTNIELLKGFPENIRYFVKPVEQRRWLETTDPVRDCHIGCIFADTMLAPPGRFVVDTGYVTLKKNAMVPALTKWKFLDDIHALMTVTADSPAVFFSITHGLVDGLLCLTEGDAILAAALFTNTLQEAR